MVALHRGCWETGARRVCARGTTPKSPHVAHASSLHLRQGLCIISGGCHSPPHSRGVLLGAGAPGEQKFLGRNMPCRKSGGRSCLCSLRWSWGPGCPGRRCLPSPWVPPLAGVGQFLSALLSQGLLPRAQQKAQTYPEQPSPPQQGREEAGGSITPGPPATFEDHFL